MIAVLVLHVPRLICVRMADQFLNFAGFNFVQQWKLFTIGY